MTLHATRVTVAVIGVLFIVAGIGFFGGTRGEDAAWLWSSWMIVAGLACIVFAWRTESAAWWQISRIGAVIGVMSRMGAVLTRWNSGVQDAGSAVAAICVLTIATIAVSRMWSVDLRYWSRVVAVTGDRRAGDRRGG